MAKKTYVSNKDKRKNEGKEVPVLSSPTKSIWGKIFIILLCVIMGGSGLFALIYAIIQLNV